MSNPIQQAIEALNRSLSWLSSYPGGGTMRPDGPYEQSRAALSALQSLQGVELPPLPEPDERTRKGLAFSGFAMEAYARTAVAAAMARGAVPHITPAQAMDALQEAFVADPSYAWTWHCGVWAAAHDEGMETSAANRAAARLMSMAFNVDTSKHENFAATQAATPEATQPTQAEAPSERERFDAYWLKRQRERGFGAKLTDAEMLAHSSDQDDEFHAWCAALATQQAGQGEAKISTEHGPWLPSTYGGEEGETYCQRCLLRSKFLGQRKCDPHIVYAPPAPQQQEQERKRWLCLTCKSDTPGRHGLMDDRVTPCPYAARSSEGGE